MQCSSCGTILSSGVSICPKCGSRVSASTYFYEDALPYDVVSYDAIPYVETHPTASREPKTVLAPALPPVTPITPPTGPTFVPVQKALPSTPPPPQKPRRPIKWEPLLLILLPLILIIGGAASISYATLIHPADLQAQATAVAHNFLNAQAQGTAQSSLRATSTANAETPDQIYQQATSGTPVINDPLKDDSGDVWFHYGQAKAAIQCVFRAGAYHMVATSPSTNFCPGIGTLFSSLAFQVQVTIIKGDAGGLMFRFSATNTNLTAYAFIVSPNGGYSLAITDQQQSTNLKSGSNPAVITGLKQSNQLTVIARSNHLYIYINGKFVDSVVDNKIASGHIAFVASSTTGATDVAFSNVKVWGL